MTIADTDAYGDSEYQASNGNIASSARYAAFGSVFHSSVASMGADMTASVSMLDKKTTRPMTSLWLPAMSMTAPDCKTRVC